MKTLKQLITMIALLFALSTNGQTTWTVTNNGQPSAFAINDFEIVGSDIYAGGSFYNGSNFEARLYKSSNNGANWSQVITTGLTTLFTGNGLLSYNNKLFISGSISNTSQNYSLYVSLDNGQTWTVSNNGLPSAFAINDFEIVGSDIYAGGSFYNGSNFEARLYKSSNNGANWSQVITTGLTTLFTGNGLLSYNNKLFISGSISNTSQNYSVYVSNIQTTSIFERDLGIRFLTYPNPFKYGIFISGLKSNNFDLLISSIEGKLIKTYNFRDLTDSYYLDLSELNSGIYILNIQIDRQNSRPIKMIKE